MKVLPLFTSAYSFRSILTLDKKAEEGGADSIIEICKTEGIKNMYLVEDNMVGFLEAKKHAGKELNLRFGLRLTFCADIKQKTDESGKTECKYVIFACSPVGYGLLTRIFTAANLQGFHHKPRLDFVTLKQFWNEEELTLAVPFYDSFIYRNAFHPANCIPDFSFTQPVFFIENNGLYLDDVIVNQIDDFDKNKKYDRQNVKSIYYKQRKDFLAWQTYKCIQNGGTLRVPEMKNCMSDAFCLESWKEVNV